MDKLQSLARKITFVLFLAQSLASAGIIAFGTLNSIVSAKLSDNPGWAGVPTAVYLLAGALAAFGWGYVFDAIGRRGGLSLGLVSGVIGSGLSFHAIASSSFGIFLVGMVFLGLASAALGLSRFAAAEVHPPEARGRAISNVVLGGTVGAVVGPFIVEPSGAWFGPWAGDADAGAYAISLILFALGALVVYLGLRPDPRDLGRQVADLHPESTPAGRSASGARSILEIFRQPAAQVALVSMALGQMVMVLVMVITSLHMRDHQHGLSDISIVMSAHTTGMFAFSILSGRLADRWGRGPVIITGAATLILACVAATMSPDVLPLGVALFLLGLGWNFCFVGGSTLLSDQLSPEERARTQGFNDLVVGLASALGSLQSGFIFSAFGFNIMAFISAVVALIPLSAALVWTLARARPSAAVSP